MVCVVVVCVYVHASVCVCVCSVHACMYVLNGVPVYVST